MVNILVPNEFLILFGRNIFPLIESTCGLRDGFLRALDDHPIVESSFKPQVRSGKSPDELYCLSHQIQIQIKKHILEITIVFSHRCRKYKGRYRLQIVGKFKWWRSA